MNVNWMEPVETIPTIVELEHFRSTFCRHCSNTNRTCKAWEELAAAYNKCDTSYISPENIVRLIGRVNHVEVEPFFCRRYRSTRTLLYFALIEAAIQLECNKEESADES